MRHHFFALANIIAMLLLPMAAFEGAIALLPRPHHRHHDNRRIHRAAARRGTNSRNMFNLARSLTDPPRSHEGGSNAENGHSSGVVVPASPCIRICRYNPAFYGGRVCIGCFRETYEIGNWQSMTAREKSLTLMDAIDRRTNNENDEGDRDDDDDDLDDAFGGAITVDELKRQYSYWSDMDG
jgi:predicted Fe-S protein YdhL (DUF1289 family)